MTVISACQWSGVETTIASMSLRSSMPAEVGDGLGRCRPSRHALRCMRAGDNSAMADDVDVGLCRKSIRWRVPMRPAPIMPTRTRSLGAAAPVRRHQAGRSHRLQERASISHRFPPHSGSRKMGGKGDTRTAALSKPFSDTVASRVTWRSVAECGAGPRRSRVDAVHEEEWGR